MDFFGLVTLLGAATVFGGQLFCMLAVLPALSAFPGGTSAAIHQEALSQRPHRYLRPVSIVTLVSTVVLLGLLVREDDRPAALTLLGIGLLFLIVSGAVSSREWPINHEIDGWGSAPVLDRYAVLRAKWDSQHRVRTALSLISLACFVLAALVSQEL